MPPLSRRSVLRAVGAAAVIGPLSGCSAPWEDLRVQPWRGDPPPAPPAPGADELARRDLLADVVSLQAACAGGAGTGTGGTTAPAVAGVVTALVGSLGEAAASLDPTAAGPPPTPGTPGDLDGPGTPPAALVAALWAAAGRASAHLPVVTGPMARLVAALAAGHQVAATALEVAAGGADPGPAPMGPGHPVATAGSTAPDPLVRGALVTAAAAEAGAEYGYGVLAVHLTDPVLSWALVRREEHRRAVVALAGGTSATDLPAPAAFAPGAPVTGAAGALALAATLEDGTADAWADLVAVCAPAERAGAATALTTRALSAEAWRRSGGRGAALRALPGLTGRG